MLGKDERTAVEASGSTSAIQSVVASQYPRPTRSNISAPRGAYLDVKTAVTQGGKSYVSRSGYAKLANSSHFVSELRQDFNILLQSFIEESKPFIALRNVTPAEEEQKFDQFSPFQTFVKNYRQFGWHHAQMFWSEHEETRLAFYDTVTRIFAEPLNELSSVKVNDQLTDDIILRACGSLFALYVCKTTTVLKAEHRKKPGHDVRISLEADVYQTVLSLPSVSEPLLSSSFPTAENALQPVDDVTFVLRKLLGANEEGGRSCFDILAPTSFGIRSPIVTNVLTSKQHEDRRRHAWGHIEVQRDKFSTSKQLPLTRAETGYAMARQALGLSLLKPVESLESSLARHDTEPLMLRSDEGESLRLARGETRQTFAGPASGMLAPRLQLNSDAYDTVLDDLEMHRAELDKQKSIIFGTADVVKHDDFVARLQQEIASLENRSNGKRKAEELDLRDSQRSKLDRMSARMIIDSASEQVLDRIVHRARFSSSND